MLVELPNKSTFFSPMQTDPLNIREKLFQGIDRDYNVTNMGIVVEVLGELENFHMSREELEATRLGKHINELRRKNTSDKNLAGRAKSLIKKWRDLLSSNGGGDGPGPGGGGGNNNNNNSSLVTNGNAGARLQNNSNVATTSPRLSGNNHGATPRGPSSQSRGAAPPSHPGGGGAAAPSHPQNKGGGGAAPPNHRQQPQSRLTPVSSSPRVPVTSPRVSSKSVSRAQPPPPASSHVSQSARKSVPPSPAKPPPPPQLLAVVNNGSGSRESPVVISSGSSSPSSVQSVHSNSRPNSPSASSISIIPKSREVSPHRSRTTSPAVVAVGSKRPRPKDDHEGGPDAKHVKRELPNGSSLSNSPNHLHDRPKKNVRRPKPREPVVNSGYDLAKQMKQATSRKLKTTQELVENLGIKTKVQTSPPVTSVTDLVPNENKSELMDRFFSSQKVDEEVRSEKSEPPSRPSTAVEEVSSSEAEASSAGPSRVQTPAAPKETVEDILASLPPIDTEAILAEIEKEVAEEEEEVEGLIPAYKPHKEITSNMIDDLNNGQLDYIGGIRDHSGEFKEWHEMASVESKDGELLHILPYSVID